MDLALTWAEVMQCHAQTIEGLHALKKGIHRARAKLNALERTMTLLPRDWTVWRSLDETQRAQREKTIASVSLLISSEG